ncbi:MAG: hypothetical protein NC324_10630 [Bacteroides sp.]|nr:hypothetical protein [Bacteroides sp.]
MKRFLVCFLMVFASALVQLEAQEHMLFMKTPIDGTITEFAAKMRAKGFVQILVSENFITMKGEFMGKECNIHIVGTKKTKIVYMVSVIFDRKYTSWYSLKSNYNDIRDSYIGKYGMPTKDYHFFSSPYYEGDGYEMQAVRLDKCNYLCFWDDMEEGCIMISIMKDSWISVSYQDGLNTKKGENEKKVQINEDI